MIKFIFFFYRTYSALLKNYFFALLILSTVNNIAFAQEIKYDTVIEPLTIKDTLINSTAFITIKDSTKLYIVKGTITKNLITKNDNSKNIVYIENKLKQEDKISVDTELKIVKEQIIDKESNRKIKITSDSITPVEKSKIILPPYSQQNYFTSSQNKITTSNNTYSHEIALNKNYSFKDLINAEILYKVSTYNYLCNSICVLISTLEIRSPSIFI